MISKGEKKIIINTYQMIINEFFTKFLESEICSYESGSLGEFYNAEEKLNYHLYIGITIIHRVFEYIFLKTKNIMTTYYYTDSAYSYYFEYLEQIYKANLLYNFNKNDDIDYIIINCDIIIENEILFPKAVTLESRVKRILLECARLN